MFFAHPIPSLCMKQLLGYTCVQVCPCAAEEVANFCCHTGHTAVFVHSQVPSGHCIVPSGSAGMESRPGKAAMPCVISN